MKATKKLFALILAAAMALSNEITRLHFSHADRKNQTLGA